MVESIVENLFSAFFAEVVEKSIVFILMAIMIVALGIFSRHMMTENKKLRDKTETDWDRLYGQLREDRERDVNAFVENTKALQKISTILEMMKK